MPVSYTYERMRASFISFYILLDQKKKEEKSEQKFRCVFCVPYAIEYWLCWPSSTPVNGAQNVCVYRVCVYALRMSL